MNTVVVWVLCILLGMVLSACVDGCNSAVANHTCHPQQGALVNGHHRVWVDINNVSRVLFAGVDAYLTDTFRTHPEIPADIMGCRFETDYDLEDGCVLVQSSNSKIMGNRVKSRGPVTFKVVSEESCC